MKAIKENKVYAITETEKARYIEQGFDIYDDNGDVIAYGRGKTVSMEEYERIKKELDELKAARAENEISETVAEAAEAAEMSSDKAAEAEVKPNGKKTAGK